MDIRKEFGHMVRHHRKEKKLTQETLAEMCDLSTREICGIESGKINPKLDTALKLCLACGINAGELPPVKTDEEWEYTYKVLHLH